MFFKRLRIYIQLAFERKIFKRALYVALVVGIILNLINQGGPLITLEFSQVNYLKLLLTFFVPYFVSTYSSVLLKATLSGGDVSTLNAVVRCKSCKVPDKIIKRGEIVPSCSACQNNTKWLIIQLMNDEEVDVYQADEQEMEITA